MIIPGVEKELHKVKSSWRFLGRSDPARGGDLRLNQKVNFWVLLFLFILSISLGEGIGKIQWDNLVQFLVFPDIAQESFLHAIFRGLADALPVREMGLQVEGAKLCQLSWTLGRSWFHGSFPLTSWVALSVSPQASGIGAVMVWPILGGTRAGGGGGITEWFGLKGIFNTLQLFSCCGQGHLLLDQVA